MRERKKILKSLERATEKGLSLTYLAQETGIPYGSVKQFRQNGSLGADRRATLDAWLIAHPEFSEGGEKNGDAAPRKSAPLLQAPEALLAQDLRTLADILDSPDYPIDFKARKFAAWVRVAHEDIEKIMIAFKSREEDGDTH